MKRIIAGTAAFLMAAVLFFPLKVSAISAQKAILLDAQTGRVLFEKDPDGRSLIASTTKIMTALIVCEQCNVPVGGEWISEMRKYEADVTSKR